tara:strand:+ start:1261 stop:1770 length:510 start_codon:yes stop_codon:yes gene_type:complete
VSTLYEISDDLKALEELLIEQGGDVSTPADEDVVMSWLQENQEQLEKKLENYGRMIRELEARSKARLEEAKRLKTRATVDANAAQNLKERLMWFMQERGTKKVETDSFRFSVRKNGGRAPLIYDANDVPKDYMMVFPTPNTTKIREELEQGINLPFARLGERGTTLSMR